MVGVKGGLLPCCCGYFVSGGCGFVAVAAWEEDEHADDGFEIVIKEIGGDNYAAGGDSELGVLGGVELPMLGGFEVASGAWLGVEDDPSVGFGNCRSGGEGGCGELVPLLPAGWVDVECCLPEETAVHAAGLVELFDCVT